MSCRAPVIVAALLGFFSPLVASAADKAVASAVTSLQNDVAGAEAAMASLQREYGERRGLIGPESARSRYEEAVYNYLMGHYDRAADTFYTLVEADALPDAGMKSDSEWYLAQSLFELKNYTMTVEVCDRIIDDGPTHPFFADAVRLELEVYGLLKDTERFNQIYNRYIVSGRVAPSDAVKYTVAKSFWHQGQSGRAKSTFMQVSADGAYYGKAHYFLGAIRASEGDYEGALQQFLLVDRRGDKETEQLRELTWLALGRIYYELGQYPEAVEAYQRIPPSSQYFADQLYELAWTFIKQGKWDEALQYVEIFLIAFPDHPYAMQLRLDQGHLHLKTKAYENALASYQSLVKDYTPLERRLEEIRDSREDPGEYFEALVQDKAFEDGGKVLPAYARVMLKGDEDVSRVVEAWKALEQEGADLGLARQMARQVEAAMKNRGAIGTFSAGREAILGLRERAVSLRIRILETEIDHLSSEAPEELQPDIKALGDKLEVLRTRAEDVQGIENARLDRRQAYENQIQAVQDVAVRTKTLAVGLQANSEAVRRALAEEPGKLGDQDAQYLRTELDHLDRELATVIGELDEISGGAARQRLLAAIPPGDERDAGSELTLVEADLARLRDQVRSYRSRVAEADPTVFSALDGMWGRIDALDRSARDIRSHLDEVERTERKVIERTLAQEATDTANLGGELKGAEAEAHEVALDVTRAGFAKMESEVSDTIMQADMGIVDVYWLRKTEVADEITRLRKERVARLKELDARFGLIRQKLEE